MQSEQCGFLLLKNRPEMCLTLASLFEAHSTPHIFDVTYNVFKKLFQCGVVWFECSIRNRVTWVHNPQLATKLIWVSYYFLA